MKRIFLLVVAFLTFSISMAHADQQVTSTTVKVDNQKIVITVPSDLIPGYHSINVYTSDPVTGAKTTRKIFFCKDLENTIHWDNVCGTVTAVASQTRLESAKTRSQLPAYDPVSQPKRTFDTQVAAFATLTAMAAGGVATLAGGGLVGGGLGGASDVMNMAKVAAARRREDSSEESKQEKDLEAPDSSHLAKIEREIGRGDALPTWKLPFTEFLNALFIAGARKTSKFSPMLSRIFYDGNYLRAMFGSLAVVLHPVALVLGVLAAMSVNAQALPPHWVMLTTITGLGVFDAFAGLIAGSIYFLSALLTGHVGSQDELLTLVGTIAIFFAPALIASAFRPLRREVKTFAEKWERITDYALATILTGWTMTKMVGSLSSLAGVQLPITVYAFRVGAWCAILVLLRLIGEDIATYIFPRRLAELHPELQHPGKAQTVVALIFRTIVFIFLAEPFVGNSFQLWIGTALFLLPGVLQLTVSRRFPKSGTLNRFLPKGALKIVFIVIVGSLFAKWMQSMIPNSIDFLRWGFVLLGIPTLVLQLLGYFADRSGEGSWKFQGYGKYIYRIGGIFIFYLIIQIALGRNLINFT